MTKFEKIAIDKLLACKSVEEAQRTYLQSCTLCCLRGRRVECGRCVVDMAHNRLVVLLSKESKR